MKIVRNHMHSDRYLFDFKCCTTNKGFAQVDTKQDASYFGTWANPFELKIVCYCEGDISVETYDDDQEFITGMRKLKTWNDEMGFGMAIDPGFNVALKEKFISLGLGDLLH